MTDREQRGTKPVVPMLPYPIDLQSNSRRVALIGMFTASYVAIVYAFPFISYGQVNVRVADFLRGLLPFFPEPLIIANAFATFLSDLSSPFGYFDFVGSTLVILVSTFTATRIFRMRFKGTILVGYIAHTIILATWLTTLISSSVLGSVHLFDSAWFAFAIWIYGGNIISDVVFPYFFFNVLKRRLVYFRRPSVRS